jgi:hypothetical protein
MANRWTRVISRAAIPGWILAFWRPIYQAINAASNLDWVRQHMSPVLSAYGYWIALACGLLWLGYLVTRPESASPVAQSPLRVLERYCVSLAGLKDHVDRVLWLAKETEKPADLGHMMEIESALGKIRAELINQSPSLFPTSVALEFQKAPDKDGYTDVRDRLPKAIDELMKVVHRQWGKYAEQKGIAPMRFRESPVVKLNDL